MKLNMKYFDLFNDDRRLITAPMDIIISRFLHNSSNILVKYLSDDDMLDRDFSMGYFYAVHFTAIFDALIIDMEKHQVELRMVWDNNFISNKNYFSEFDEKKWISVDRARKAFLKNRSNKNREILRSELSYINVVSSVKKYVGGYYSGMGIVTPDIMEYCKNESEFIYFGYRGGPVPAESPKYGVFGLNLESGLEISSVS